MPVLFALLPVALLLALLLGARWSAGTAGAAAAVVAAIVATTVFGFGAGAGVFPALGGAFAEALFQSATILWIIFPALCIHEYQTASGGTALFGRALAGISGDPRIVALLIAWFFALFMEGAAGFGTPIALAAPLLVALGFTPVTALVLAIVGSAVAVPFGAVGTPMAALVGETALDPPALSVAVALLNASVGWIMAATVVRVAAADRQVAGGGMGWAILAAAFFFVPVGLLAWTTGPELPSLGGAVVGGLAFILFVRRENRAETRENAANAPSAGALIRAASPYLATIALILATRLIGPLALALRGVTLEWSLPGGFGGSVQPLLHPGTLLLLAFLFTGLSQAGGRPLLSPALATVLRRLPPVGFALVAVLTLARLMVHAGMIDLLARATAGLFGGGWPLVAPLLGALGAFVTGSGTASNILLGEFQVSAAQLTGTSPLLIAAAQAVGAAAGNLIAPHNIVAGAATIGLVGREGEILRRTFPPALLYAGAAGVVALAVHIFAGI